MAQVVSNSHIDRAGNFVTYDHVPKRPELPSEYSRYVYPVEPWPGHATVMSGYDLGLPDAEQRRGAHLTYVGHGGVDLPQERGAPVRVVALRGAVGDPVVLYTGPLFGTTVLLLYNVREDGGTHAYVALHGHLDGIAAGLARGQTVSPGTVIGFVGDTGAAGIVHLHYETRLVRGTDPMQLDPPTAIMRQEHSIACDPRNLLPLRMGRRGSSAVANDDDSWVLLVIAAVIGLLKGKRRR